MTTGEGEHVTGQSQVLRSPEDLTPCGANSGLPGRNTSLRLDDHRGASPPQTQLRPCPDSTLATGPWLVPLLGSKPCRALESLSGDTEKQREGLTGEQGRSLQLLPSHPGLREGLAAEVRRHRDRHSRTQITKPQKKDHTCPRGKNQDQMNRVGKFILNKPF